MSKDVIIAGAIAAGCVALVAVALLAPKSKSGDEPAKSETAPITTSADPFAPLPGDFGYGAGTGAVAFGPAGTGTGATTGFPPPVTGFPPSTGTGGFATTPPAGTGFGPGAGAGGFGTTGATGFGTTGTTGAAGFGTTPPAETTAAATPSTTEHVVAAGETLGDISLKYYKTSKQWKRIVEANPGLDPRTVKVGQKLKIVLDQPAAAANTPAAPVAGPGERTYTIKANDSLYGIAKRELGSGARWKEIQSLNPGLDHNDLKVGKVIKLPAGATTGAATTGGAPAETGSAGGRTHTVAKGETLADISKKYFGTAKRWKDIVAANPGVNPEGLKVGQKLNLPESAKAGAEAAPATGAPATTEAEYTVKAGDTPASIARAQIGGSDAVQKLLAANPGLNPKALRIGQKLRIPGKAAATAPVQPAIGQPAAGQPVGGFPPATAGQPVDPWATPGGGFGPATTSSFGPGAPSDFANPYNPGGPDAWNSPAPGNAGAGGTGAAPGTAGRR